MTLGARLDDFEMTLEHLLMDVFVSKSSSLPSIGIVPAIPNHLWTVPIVTDVSSLHLSHPHTCGYVLLMCCGGSWGEGGYCS